MPRYRFAWSNLPDQLLKKLAKALQLPGDPSDGLRRRYGSRPKANFVQDAWPTLLEAWLPTDSASREFMVEELQGAGLGRSDISVRTKRGQLDYLASCRNAPTLRSIALAAFLAAGEPNTMQAPPMRNVPSSPEEPPPAGTGRARDQAQTPSGHEGLDAWVIATLKEAFDLPELHRDVDGDIPIPRGSAVLFIRPHDDDSPFLQIFAPILRGFRMSPDVYEAVNAINSQIPMAKATVNADGSIILLEAQLLTHTLSPQELLLAIDLVSGAADHFDTLLQARFGGETLLDDDDDAIEV